MGTKTIFLIPSLNSGGIEIYLLRFLRFKKSEIEAFVLVRDKNSGDLLNEYKALGIPLVFMPLGYFNPARWCKYYFFFKRNVFDTICDFNANFAGIPIWLAKMAGIKNRITFYRQGKDHFMPLLIKRAYNFLMNRIVYKYSTKILANSSAAIDFFFPYRAPDDLRFKVIYNGIDFKQLQIEVNKSEIKIGLGIPEKSFIIGHVGRLDKAKNHRTILILASKLIKRYSNIYFVLCGRETEKLADEVSKLDISGNVRLLGYRSDIPVLMQIFNLFYFPSITEGQPNALLEAMAIGLPIIASNIKPIREIMPEGSMLFDPFDIINVINCIQNLIENPEKCYLSDLADYTRRIFNYSDRFSDFYLELI